MIRTLALFSLFMISALQPSFANDHELAIPFTKQVLDNGLTVIVHEDKKAPIVAVNVWYHIGSKNEKLGRTGFAHLFEHLMFNGSENFNDDWFKGMEKIGATGINGTTNFDRTNYFQVVPKNALEVALWMESDRMGHLLGAIDQAKLDEQRDVVKNEKRQGQNQPYGRAFDHILSKVFPYGHPYSWSPIGSMDDLNAASLEDVHEWFKSHYGAANATLTIAGDVDTAKTIELVKKYFGDIASGPPQSQVASWVAKRDSKSKEVMYDRVPQARLYKIWNIPGWGESEADYLSIASSVLSSDKKSRLYNRLVYKDKLASDVSAFSFDAEIAGLFGIIATALNPDDLDKIDAIIDEELALFLKQGPSKEELSRIKSGRKSDLVRGRETIAAKAEILAQSEVFGGSPDANLKSISRIQNATSKQVLEASRKWLTDGDFTLNIVPYGKYATSESIVDRSKGFPEIGAAPQVTFDRLERAELENGLKVLLAKRTAVPVIRMQLLVDAGHAADFGVKSGTANITMNMLDEGTEKMDAVEISTELAEMGTYISSQAGLDTSIVAMNTLTDNLDRSLAIYTDIILEPSFPQSELDRLKNQQLAMISQEKNSPFGAGLRLLPGILYGDNHAYSGTYSGSGEEDDVASLTVDDVRNYHDTWFKAGNATLVVAGDINMQELLPLLESSLGKMPAGKAPEKEIKDIAARTEPVIYLIDRPDSEQSAILATMMLPKYGFDGELSLQLLNEVVGASFNSRINMNLREDKGWAYGAGSIIRSTAGQRPYIAYAPVQSDKTGASMSEIYMELSSVKSDRPASAAELARSLDKRILTLPGRWETAAAVESDMVSMVRYGLTEEYWDNYASELKEIELDDVNEAARTLLNPDNMLWVVVGDRSKIEQQIIDADLGKIIVVNKDGEVID